MVRFKKHTLDLTLCVIRQFGTVDGKVLRNQAVSPSLTRFDLNAQQSRKK
jgi:hypothetical protein